MENIDDSLMRSSVSNLKQFLNEAPNSSGININTVSDWNNISKEIESIDNSIQSSQSIDNGQILNENLFKNKGFRTNKDFFIKKTKPIITEEDSKVSTSSYASMYKMRNKKNNDIPNYNVNYLGERVKTNRYKNVQFKDDHFFNELSINSNSSKVIAKVSYISSAKKKRTLKPIK